jgi:hypothetical protein
MANRRNRRNTRRNRKNRRNTRRGGGLFGTLYSPISHLLQATGNAAGAVTNTTRNVVKRGLGGVNRVGRSVTGHANAAVRNLVSRKRRGSRRN